MGILMITHDRSTAAHFADRIAVLIHEPAKWVARLRATDTGGGGQVLFRPVNWVNGPLLAHVGRRKGFDVTYAPFRHRAGGNIVTMTAQAGD